MVEIMDFFEEIESNVRVYCRDFPATFSHASGYNIYDIDNNKYIDFFSGASALNYGHNHPKIKQKLMEYIESDGITHSLDMATVKKNEFLRAFYNIILRPRKMNYKIQFCGPTGTNAVEAAIKLARKVTGRTQIITFTNAFHGVTLGALSLTGSSSKRKAAGVPLNYTYTMPYDGYFGDELDTSKYLEKLLSDSSSGFELPAAIILETIQAEGGVNVASHAWLQNIQKIAQRFEILLIIDDIQVGCGRTGTFFSFEHAGITPDLIVLSKSLSGYGMPMSIVLLKPHLDKWQPGEHNGTFRGNNLAFVAAIESLNFWSDDCFSSEILAIATYLYQSLKKLVSNFSVTCNLRGKGMLLGIEWPENLSLASEISKLAFTKGLIIETSGADNQVLKFLPPLNIDRQGIDQGIEILHSCITEAIDGK